MPPGNFLTSGPRGRCSPPVLKKRFQKDVNYMLGNVFLNQNLWCSSLIFVPLPAAQDSLKDAFGNWVFWDTWVDYRIMEQHINLAEFWKSRDRRSPRLYMSRSHKLYWSCSKQFRPALYDMKLTLGYFHSFILNGRKSLKLSKHSLAGGESLAWRPAPIPPTPVAGSIWTPSSF